ncbi:MAG TPA: mechanosensitive ion channel protein MscS [Flavobacteriales bacterium]|jgi:miniconductance mechanosensitive channel|nr:mechanosensitive ion channel protein MscS [Flavobacteriales bacterium]
MSELISTQLLDYIKSFGIAHEMAIYIKLGILLLALFLLGFVLNFIGKSVIVRIITRISVHTKSNWDDILVEKKVFERLANILPALAVALFSDLIFADFVNLIPILKSGIEIFIIVIIISVIYSFLNALKDILQSSVIFKDKPINSYIQLMKIVIGIVAAILILSLMIGQSPLTVLTAMGALTAVIILVFKDTILGFVASIQLAANDMIRVGDWVTVSSYGADGDVIDISLNTVKVKNFDNTISTVPTYAFISNSVQNWRGMSESGGRRIKRALNIKISSIKFADEKLLEYLSKVSLIQEFIQHRQNEIETYNKDTNAAVEVLINGRRMTNIGLFRNYIEYYLKAHPKINTDLTCMVRQLAPGPEGLPLEVYAFSSDKVWVNYERIMADIFDHLLATVQHFDLEIFEQPSGTDFRTLRENIS